MTPTESAVAVGDDEIRVLTVDDDGDFARMTGTFLEREVERLSVETAASAEAARAQVAEDDPDCVVSDHDMPAATGLDLLADVRETHPELPFILFTGKGSEDIASEAISAGVSEYMQKAGGSEQYAVLANRIENAVEQYRAARAVERTQERFRLLVEESTDAILVVAADGIIRYAAPSAEPVLGWSPQQLEGRMAFDFVHPDDLERVVDEFEALRGRPERRSVEFRYETPAEDHVWVEARGRNLLDADVIEGLIVYVRDVTEVRAQAAELAATTERLEAVVEASPLPINALDTEGRVQLWNRAAEAVFGWDAAEVMDEPTPLVSEAHEAEFEGFRDAVLDGEALIGVRITRRDADGTPIDLRLSTAPIEGPDGEVTGFMAVFEPVDERVLERAITGA